VTAETPNSVQLMSHSTLTFAAETVHRDARGVTRGILEALAERRAGSKTAEIRGNESLSVIGVLL
jgi:hypothetical protein